MTTTETTLLARPREFLHRMVGLGVILILLGVGAAWAVRRYVTRPLAHHPRRAMFLNPVRSRSPVAPFVIPSCAAATADVTTP